MNTDQLVTFLTVADTGSFSKAAKELFLAPQSVTQQIDNMEAELGVHLFDRTNKGVILTTGGRQYRQDAKRMLELMKSSKSRAESASAGRDTVTFSHFSSPMIIRIGQELARLHPDIVQGHQQPSGYPETDIKDLETGVCDLMEWIAEPDIDGHNLVFLPLALAHAALLVSNSNPLASRASIRLEDLDGMTVACSTTSWYPSIVSGLSSKAPHAKLASFGCQPIGITEICMNGGVWLNWDCSAPIDTALLTLIPLPSEYDSYYGFLHMRHPTPAVQTVLNLAEQLYPLDGDRNRAVNP